MKCSQQTDRIYDDVDALLKNISTTTDYASFADADLVIEAAVEEMQLKNIEEVCYRCIGITETETMKIVVEAYGSEEVVTELYEKAGVYFRARYEEMGHMPIKQGARLLLEWLKKAGIPTALASSTKEELVKQELADAGLLEFFDVIVCGDMVERSKPAPDIFLHAMGLLGADPSECYIIEDSFNGIRAAHASGATPLMVPDILQPDEEMRDKARAIFKNLDEVREYLEAKAAE